MPDKHDVIGADGFANELHLRFYGGPVALPIIARHARTNQILPRVSAPPCFRNHVIDCQRLVRLPTILATMVVAPENVLA